MSGRPRTAAKHAVLGALRVALQTGRPGGGAIEVAVSPDDQVRFAVPRKYSDDIAVFDPQRALASGFRTSGFVGDILLGIAVVGTAVVPDGRWLHATSEVANVRAHRGPARLLGAPGHAVGDQPEQWPRPTRRTRSWPRSPRAVARCG